MRKSLFSEVGRVLEEFDFVPLSYTSAKNGPMWFRKIGASNDLGVCLRVEYGPKFRTLSFSLGWHHEGVRQFCGEALEESWPDGHRWLLESGFLSSPCMNYFNLGEVMGWGLSALLVDNQDHLADEIFRLCELIDSSGWSEYTLENLQALYVRNQKPFSWLASNAALRLAEIAAICLICGTDRSAFEKCAVDYKHLIQADMFGTGVAESWISALREKCTVSK